ncbi:gfo/Idh/MocA family oxidoreductase [Paracoccus sp. S-4012]|uniref:Gfo/Idh/MocA family protein n=1 Tax=Paracoccus sp. S-4012 TaxID=2665648 RepID=UPI0012AFA37A|nr:Gfo/Idh/MocA family oxidoreductase [Paracoccus sp. S-4012]MRX52082.1 gfo/Idh/MocA family oxidoreductase [Paracoccus sp. S-4012]
MTHRGCLIGCGFFARNHMHAWTDLPGARITAVCDTDRARAEAFARDFGVASIYTDAAEMLAAERPDFCDIATTPPSHRALVELAAPHARLLICQKPIADTLEDARAMVAACEAAGAALVIHENFRWQAPLVRMKAVIEQGGIGTPRHGRFEFRHKWDVYAGQPYLAEFPRLAIMDVGVHVFDLARHFMGEAAAITCETQRRNPRVAGEDAFTVLTRHATGDVSVCDVSFHSRYDPEPFPQVWARVEGDEGTIELLPGHRLVIHGEAGRVEEDGEPPVPAWGERPWHVVQDSVRRFQAHVIDVLDGRTMPQPSGADNVRTLALCLAAYESAETGRRVTLEAQT